MENTTNGKKRQPASPPAAAKRPSKTPRPGPDSLNASIKSIERLRERIAYWKIEELRSMVLLYSAAAWLIT